MHVRPLPIEPKKTRIKRNRFIIGSVIFVILIFGWLLNPFISPFDFIHDNDFDGYSDAFDEFPYDNKNWTMGEANISFEIDYELLLNESGMSTWVDNWSKPWHCDIGIYYASNATSYTSRKSLNAYMNGEIENSSIWMNHTYRFPIGANDTIQLVYYAYIWIDDYPTPHEHYPARYGLGYFTLTNGEAAHRSVRFYDSYELDLIRKSL
jgi:hypothetical protein